MAFQPVNTLNFSAGQNIPVSLVSDGTNMYATFNNVGGPGNAGGLGKFNINSFTETGNLTFSPASYTNAADVTVLGGNAYVTFEIPSGSVTTSTSGLVVEVATSTMVQGSHANLWSPAIGNLRTSVAIGNDGTYIYVGSSSSYVLPSGPHLQTMISQLSTGLVEQAGSPITLSGTWSAEARTLISDADAPAENMYMILAANQSPSDPSYPNDAVIKLSVSPFAQAGLWNAPTADQLDAMCYYQSKLYVGSTAGNIYRVDAASMTLDKIVISIGAAWGGINWLMASSGFLYVATGGSNYTTSMLLIYSLSTYQLVASVSGSQTTQFGSAVSAGFIFGAYQYWSFLSSPGQILQTAWFYTGSSYVYGSQGLQSTWSGGFAGQSLSFASTSTGSAWGSALQAGYGVSTLISSSAAMLQAALMGDPHFTGFEGESFFFNGEPDKYYNIFSDKDIQINSLFRHWETAGDTPMTAIEEIGVILFDGTKIRMTSRGSVEVNGRQLRGSLDLKHTNIEVTKDLDKQDMMDFEQKEGYGKVIKACIIEFWPFTFMLIQATDNVNLPYLNFIARIDDIVANRPHGIVGQTADFDGKAKEKLDGEESDYEVSDLWATDFVFNKFIKKYEGECEATCPKSDYQLASCC